MISEGVGPSIPAACQDWANTKAAYRFLANPAVSEAQILEGHFQATKERAQAAEQPILVLHDTTEFTYQRNSQAAIGLLTRASAGKTKEGRDRLHTVRGILNALQPCRHSRGIAPGVDSHQVLDWASDLRGPMP